MAISTYAELQTAVANWLDRSDLTDRIPEFITLAEAEFNRRLRTIDMLERDTAFTIDSITETLPEDFLGVKDFYFNDALTVIKLQELSPDRMSHERQRWSSSAIPIYYAVIGGNFEFLPTPNDTYTGTLLYYKRIAALSNTNTTNWLLSAHPDLYLFGALREAEPYVHNDERVPLWHSRYESAMNQLMQQDARASRGGSPTTRGRSF